MFLSRTMVRFVVLAMLLPGCCRPPAPLAGAEPVVFPLTTEDYPWPRTAPTCEPVAQRFPPPDGFARVTVGERSWGQWLRHLPLRPAGTAVLSRGGFPILPGNSPILGGVVDMDVRKNQECADTIQRLWAEYLRWAGQEDKIVFQLTGEGQISWPDWKEGMRPRLEGDRLRFYQTAQPSSSRQTFERFLDAVFAWCGTYSLTQDGRRVPAADLQAGDFFVEGGSPGHAVLVADLARDAAGNSKALLLQGYIPAQSAHVLAPGRESMWFDLVPGQPVDIPRWGAFEWSALHRFTEAGG